MKQSRNRTKPSKGTFPVEPVFVASRNTVSKSVGYIRVSRISQSLDQQLDSLRQADVDIIFQDHGISGAIRTRPGLDAALSELRKGDALIVVTLDRLGRDIADLIGIVELLKQRGAHLRTLTHPIDTRDPFGEMLFVIMGALAQFERTLIIERTAERLRAKKRRGERIGRKPVLTATQIAVARRELAAGSSASSVARALRCGRSTLYRHLALKTV